MAKHPKKITAPVERFCRQVAMETAKENPTRTPSQIYAALHPNSSPVSVSVATSRLMNRPDVKETISQFLEREYDMRARGKRLKQLIRAKKEHVLADGRKVSVKDNQTSLEALKLAMKLTGELKEGGVTIDNRSINYQIAPTDAERLLEIGRQLAGLLPRGDAEEGRIDADTQGRGELGEEKSSGIESGGGAAGEG